MINTYYKSMPKIQYAIKQNNSEPDNELRDLIEFYEIKKNEIPKKTLQTVNQVAVNVRKAPPKAPIFSKGIIPKNFKAMKIDCTPSLNASLAARFDGILEVCKKAVIIDQTRRYKPSDVFITIYSARKIIINSIYDIYQKDVIGCKWRELGLEKWLDQEILDFEISDENISANEMKMTFDEFLENCSVKWFNQHNIEKYIPGEDLKDRMNKLSKKLGIEEPDCRVFAACYLKIEDKTKKHTNGIPNFVFDSNEYELVKKPQANDLIIYLNSDNTPIHFGVFLDSKRVISKHYHLCSLIHDVQDEQEATSYVILRKKK